MVGRPNGVQEHDRTGHLEGSVEEASLAWHSVRRGRRKEKDEAQSSLDAFSQTPTQDSSDDAAVPPMPDLNLLEAAEAKLDQNAEPSPSPTSSERGPRRFAMPSSGRTAAPRMPRAEVTYHNLGQLYPNAPVPLHDGEMVLHNSTLLDLTGCGALMDWVADGHGCIVEMKRMMKRTTEFQQALSMLNQFIEGDVQGQIIRITDTRLLLLPRGCRGIKGTEMEGFAVHPDNLTDVYE